MAQTEVEVDKLETVNPSPVHRRALTVIIDVGDMKLPDVAEALKKVDALGIGPTLRAEIGSWWG